MFHREVRKRICKICALVAATLILPTLAYAATGRASGPGDYNASAAFTGTDNGTGDNGKNNGKQYGHDNVAFTGTDNGTGNNGINNGKQYGHDKHVPVVPEVNPVWVLLPFSGAVLLLSWRRFSRAKP